MILILSTVYNQVMHLCAYLLTIVIILYYSILIWIADYHLENPRIQGVKVINRLAGSQSKGNFITNSMGGCADLGDDDVVFVNSLDVTQVDFLGRTVSLREINTVAGVQGCGYSTAFCQHRIGRSLHNWVEFAPAGDGK